MIKPYFIIYAVFDVCNNFFCPDCPYRRTLLIAGIRAKSHPDEQARFDGPGSAPAGCPFPAAPTCANRLNTISARQGYPRLRREGLWGYVKSILPPSAAKYYFERHVILTISLREIVKITCLSKHNSARSAVKNLFTNLF
jgi:hypothetical protein